MSSWWYPQPHNPQHSRIHIRRSQIFPQRGKLISLQFTRLDLDDHFPPILLLCMYACTIDSELSKVRLFMLWINHRNFYLHNFLLYHYIGINYSLIPLAVIIMILNVIHCTVQLYAT